MSTKLPTTMRAYQFSSTAPTLEANLQLNPSAPLPPTASPTTLKPDTILVRVLVAALNPIDFKAAELPLLGRLITGSPSTPAMDFAGRVVACGPNTGTISKTELKVGAMVYGRLDSPSKFGSLAEYTVAPRNGVTELPEGVGLDDAVCVSSTGLTAYQCVIPKLKIGAGEEKKKGKRVFINGGSGAAGTFGIQIAKAVGCHVTTTCSSRNVELCESLGADMVLDYTKVDVVAELQKMPEKFDLVVDNVGFPANLYWVTPSFTNPGAPYVQVGAPSISVGFLLENMYKTNWPGWLGGGKRPFEFLGLVSKLEDYKMIGEWMKEGKVKAVVDEVFEFEKDGPVKAYEKLRTGRARGKIIVKVAEE